jgi:hypothetical protein
MGKVAIVVDRIKLIAHVHVDMAVGEGRTSDPRSFFRDDRKHWRTQRHGDLQSIS